jgi:uncharacterized protein YjbI with pentapeptide repeats/DNA-binding LacI/PurR family transcriptional regulator
MSAPGKDELLESLRRVNAIEDPLDHEHALLTESSRLGLPVEGYRRLLLALGGAGWSRVPLLQLLSRGMVKLERWLKIPIDWALLILLLTQLTILATSLSYFLDASDRQRQYIRSLRSETTASANYRYSTSRIQNLERLAQECEGWPGLEVVGAELPGLDLSPCRELRLLPPFYSEEGFDLSHAQLARANLRGARLRKARLTGANLQGAVLREADLRGADLSGAMLSGADLEGALLEGAMLRGARLEGAHLDRARLDHADLYETDLSRGELLWASLRGANLSRAHLSGANLSRADLQDADLFQADLAGAVLNKADLRRAGTVSANLAQAQLDGILLSEGDQLRNTRGWSGEPPPIGGPQRIRFGLVRDGAQDVFFQDVLTGMREELTTRGGDFTLESCETDGSPDVIARERECVEHFVAQGVDALVIAPRHPTASLASLQVAYQAGVAIACYDRCEGEVATRYVSGSFQSNQLELGRLTGEVLVKWLSERGRRGQEVRLGVLHCGDNENCYRRFMGFRSVLDREGIRWSTPAMRGGWTPENAPLAAAVVVEHPDVEVLWSANGAGTEALVRAAATSTRHDRLVVLGTDINPMLARMLLPETAPALLLAVSGQSPREMGRCAVAATLARLQRTSTEALPSSCRMGQMPGLLYSREEPGRVWSYLDQKH